MEIRIKRAFEEPAAEDGYRVLVDGLWPRGVTKERARLDAWRKDLAPSADLRKRFAHDHSRWEEFRRLYAAELDENVDAVTELLKAARPQGTLTLVYAAKDEERNNAVALREYLLKQRS